MFNVQWVLDTFPSDNFQSANFQVFIFSSGNFTKVRLSEAPQATKGPRVWLGWARGPSTAAR